MESQYVKPSVLKMQIEQLQKENVELKQALELSKMQLDKVIEQRNEFSVQMGTIVSVVNSFSLVR